MDEHTPLEPQTVVSRQAPASLLEMDLRVRAPEPPAEVEQRTAEPRKSFFRGVAVGIGIMIPMWVWLILQYMR